ncbi:DNA-binding protein WhiA [Dialister pneumosintes]|uniref:Probable cell division protein WhiA n=1 Tax=Dialister pneumosintes TaxID=39950 RepID=A0A1B3WCD9_9FIRM|nr:DNA-binding protein WhiA [Dialister pneumosintes]AOH38634.1 DNA-binding protein WhiA [Dialister pneumosintes]
MSFTEEVKNELARLPRENTACRTAELLALLRMSGTVITGTEGKWGLDFSTSSNAVARRVLISLKKDFNLEPAILVRQGRRLRKKNVYTLTVLPFEGGNHFLEKMDIWSLGKINDYNNLKTQEEKKAYLAGAFLGGGTVSRPQSDYHLELVTKSSIFAEEISKVMKELSLHPKLTERKNDYIIYLKDGDEVGRFLQLIGSAHCYMEFENVRVMKDMRNRVNRQVNCETANLQKSVDAALRQFQQVQLIMKYMDLTELSPKIKEAAEMRLKKPYLSLGELAELLDISKSGLAHRFQKISAIAKKIKSENNLE